MKITKSKLKKIIEEEIQNVLNEKCWDGYKQAGMKKKGDKMVPNCVPLEEDLEDEMEENLRDWFGKSKSKGGKPGWVQVVSGKPCARQPGQKTTPKCVSSAKRASMSKKERESAQRRKRAADPNQPKKSGAAKPTYVATDKKKGKKKS